MTLGLLLNIAIAAEPPTTAVIGTPPQPAWAQLNTQQKAILAPLAKDWDSLENIRKKKWLAIAERYPAMKQDDQQRMQDRMREWAGLSPLERSKVRDTYKDFKQLPAEQKQVFNQKWQAYSNLPPEERQRLRESGKSSKPLSSPGTPPDAPSAEATAGITPTPAPLNTSRAALMSNEIPSIKRRLVCLLYEGLVVFSILLIGFLLPQIVLSGFGWTVRPAGLWLHVLLGFLAPLPSVVAPAAMVGWLACVTSRPPDGPARARDA